jgi:mannose/cellobiose epimerase-like protein (N-acyl-D-glucosamine 2-epimerase family)
VAANRRSLLREKLRAAVDASGVTVAPITREEPTERPSVWVRLGDRDPQETDAAGTTHVWRQAFELLVFSSSATKTEEAASEALDEAVDAVVVAVEDYAWSVAEEADSGETIICHFAQCTREPSSVDGDEGTGVAWIPGFIQYTSVRQ